jgi:hypothetical protein
MFGVFDALLNTIGGMSTSLTTIQQLGQAEGNLEQITIWPASVMGQFQSDFTGLTSYGQNALNGTFSVPFEGATMPASQSLESLMLSGGSSLIGNTYANIYGASLVNPLVPATVVQTAGMADATAMDSMQIGMSADATTSTLINQAQQIQTTASSAAAGVQDIMTVQAMASELEVLAQQHRMYAAMLREEANDLATSGVKYKQTAINNQNTQQNLQNINGNGGN